MKKIFTLTSLVVLFSFVLTGCYRSDNAYGHDDQDYWLSKTKGEVVYSDSYCNYYVVQVNNGYTVIRSYGGYKPYTGDIVYGDFNYTGSHDIYNRSTGVVFTGTVTDYDLSYNGAQDALDYYCPLGNNKVAANSFRAKK
jgi:hypothetical protein